METLNGVKKAVIVFKYATENSYVNVTADRFEYTDTHLYVFNNDQLVCLFKIENIIDAHIVTVKDKIEVGK